MRLCRRFAPTPFRLLIPISNFGGVYWTKFECISGKIRRILTTNRTRGARGDSKPLRTLRLRGEANQCASDTLADSRVQKPKNFLAFFSRLLPPPLHREAEKEMERKFLVLLRRFSLRKEQSYFNIFVWRRVSFFLDYDIYLRVFYFSRSDFKCFCFFDINKFQ